MKTKPYIRMLALFGFLMAGACPLQARPADTQLPRPARVALMKVGPLLEKQDYAKALDLLKSFQSGAGPMPARGQSDPQGFHHPAIYFAMGNCYLLQNRPEPAAEAYRRAVARDPGYTAAWLNLGKAYYETRQYTEAGYSFRQAYAAAEEKKPDYLYFSAAACMMAGDNKQAIDIFMQLLKAHPTAVKPDWKAHLVHAMLADSRNRSALPYIRELITAYTGGKKIQWQEILLYQYIQLGMATDALSFARELTGKAPEIARWWKALAHIHLKARHTADALAALTIYSFLKAPTPDEKKLLADLNLQVGIPVKAVPIYEARLHEKPDKRQLRLLVAAYQQLGRPETAIEKIAQFAPHTRDSELLLLKGELHYTLKQYRMALAAFQKAAQTDGTDTGRAWLMTGYAAWQAGDSDTARAAFQKASRHAPQKKAALSALRRLNKNHPH